MGEERWNPPVLLDPLVRFVTKYKLKFQVGTEAELDPGKKVRFKKKIKLKNK